MEEIENIGSGGFWRLVFLIIIQNPPHFGELKSCMKRGFREVLYELFKFNLCCYNIFNIKNI